MSSLNIYLLIIIALNGLISYKGFKDYTFFEKFKFNVLRNTNTERELLENTFWKAENLVTTNGNIQFIFDKNILERLEDRTDARVTFIHRTLATLKKELEIR